MVEINHIHRRAEIQLIISPKFQGKGFATKAVELGMDYAFKILNLHKLSLVVDCENQRAINVYRKLGFKEEGLLREEYFADGIYRDAYCMAVFQNEYVPKSLTNSSYQKS